MGDQENIMKSSFYTNITEDLVGQKQPKLGKMVSINGKGRFVKCIYPSCKKGISASIEAHNRHVLKCHTADTLCPECGKLLTATYIKNHLKTCKPKNSGSGNNNSKEKKTSKKREDMKKIKNSTGSGNNANMNTDKTKDTGENSGERKTSKKREEPKRIQGSESGPSGRENNDNNVKTSKEVKKEKIQEGSPA